MRMLDLIRASAVPLNLVQSAAKGALSLPPLEMLEILVYLATNNTEPSELGEQARLSLAHWDEETLQAIAADPYTPGQVLDYLADPQNFRPALLPGFLTNPSVSEAALSRLAAVVSRTEAELISTSARGDSPLIQQALRTNPNLSSHRSDDSSQDEGDDVFSEEITAYLTEHAEEIAAEDKPFQPIGGIHDEILPEEPQVKAAAAAANGSSSPGAAKTVAAKKSFFGADEQRGSALQKISRLDVKGRIQLAMKGSKEERSILVRDGTKVVALAVLDSPKITEAEVEMFASQKNVLEALLRGITMKRRFMKNYNIVRNLTCNPRTPLDLSLGLMKNLHVGDLKNLSSNKDVSDTIRKLALKMYRQKKDPSKKNV